MSNLKTPFSDSIVKDVPQRGSHGGQYDSAEIPGGPSRDGGYLAELHRDGAITKTPGSGPVKSPFKDAIEGK